jgi:hypothetical protein
MLQALHSGSVQHEVLALTTTDVTTSQLVKSSSPVIAGTLPVWTVQLHDKFGNPLQHTTSSVELEWGHPDGSTRRLMVSFDGSLCFIGGLISQHIQPALSTYAVDRPCNPP